MTPPLLVLGWGNPSRGDDALGPLFCDWLESWLAATGGGEVCEVVQDFQLQIEHAADLVGRRLVLFVDATHTDAPVPYEFQRITARRDASHSTHALSPQAVLAVFEQVYGTAPPDAFLLGLRGESFELGEPLSVAAETHLIAARDLAENLFSTPDPESWMQIASPAENASRGTPDAQR